MKLELVGKTEGLGKYEGLTSEEILSAIARHGVIKKDEGKLVKYLMKEKHWSPLDMINFVFEVETSRAIARQWLRHKSLNPQEHSQRYSDKISFEDIELRKEHPTNRQSSTDVIVFDDEFDTIKLSDASYGAGSHFQPQQAIKTVLRQVEELYEGLLSLGVAKECARMILPECTTTTLTFNGTLRSWLSFLNVRCDNHSQKEIVNLATLVGEELEKQLPKVFASIDWRNGMFM